MPGQYLIEVEGDDVFIRDLEDASVKTRRVASRAINRTLDRTRTRSASSIREQVAFPSGYLSPRTGRLSVTKRSNPTTLTGEITGRGRPTSLARFAQNTPRRGREVRLQVKPGKISTIPGAFLIKLRSGTADIETRNNMGLAVRLGPGQTLRNKRQTRRVSNGLYLLFGPSVDQVFRDVSEMEAEPAADFLEVELLRQLEL